VNVKLPLLLAPSWRGARLINCRDNFTLVITTQVLLGVEGRGE
jgi:hypothetical protein